MNEMEGIDMATKAKGKRTTTAKKAVSVAPKKVKTVESKASKVDLDALRKPLAAAKAALQEARTEADALIRKAGAMVADAKGEYIRVLSPYRDACRRAGTKCEFEGGRREAVTDMVRFVVERTDRGIRVAVKGKPKSEEVIPFAAFKQSSVSKVAYDFTDKHIGSREKVGNKGGSLSNRLRSVLSGSK